MQKVVPNIKWVWPTKVAACNVLSNLNFARHIIQSGSHPDILKVGQTGQNVTWMSGYNAVQYHSNVALHLVMHAAIKHASSLLKKLLIEWIHLVYEYSHHSLLDEHSQMT